LHRSKGVIFHLGRKPVGFDGRELELDDGLKLAADLIVLGTGVKPRTDLAAEAGLKVDNGVLVDAMMRTSRPEIFAAGDIARYPNPRGGEPIRVEHWVLAERLGQVAAENMLGAETPFVEAPFFWSNHYDLAIRYVGAGAGWDRDKVDGDISGDDSTVRYFTGERLVAAASLGRDRENLVIAQQLRGAPEKD
jgi:NADPH-dependent 2,4-dienoyl-CoA reductase/sulfur reductase-like enzyme